MNGFTTTAIHHGYDPADYHGALVPPVFQSATFTIPSAAEASTRATPRSSRG